MVGPFESVIYFNNLFSRSDYVLDGWQSILEVDLLTWLRYVISEFNQKVVKNEISTIAKDLQ